MLRLLVLAICLMYQTTALAEGESTPVLDSKIEQTRILMEKNQSNQAVSNFPGFLKLDKQDQNQGSSFGVRLLQGLALCLGTFFVLLHFLKGGKFKRGNKETRRIKVIEKVPLTTKSSLFLVEVDGETRLLSVGAEHTSFIPLNKASDENLESFEEHHNNQELNLICREDLQRTA